MENVITVFGDEQPKNLCRKIKNEYYLIDRDVYNVDDKWYKSTSMTLDSFDRTKKPSKLFDFKKCISESGKGFSSQVTYLLMVMPPEYFLENDLRFYALGSGFYLIPFCKSILNNLIVVDESLEKFRDIVREFSLGVSLDREEFNNQNIKIPVETLEMMDNSRFQAVRMSREYSFDNSREVDNLPRPKTDSTFDFLEPYMTNYSYGFELETSNGHHLKEKHLENNFVRLYDGSISGHEYASVPLKHNQFSNVFNMCEHLSKSHSTDSSCSVHVHIGGIPYSEKYLLALYLAFYRLQDELHELVFPYKKSISYLAKKKDFKDHCKYLPRLVYNTVSEIYQTFFSNLEITPSDARTTKSAKVLANTNKWNVHSRYYFVNFTNYCLKKNGTIELRLLQGSFNANRILNWLLVNQAIINYTLENADSIIEGKEKLYLKDVIKSCYNKDSNLSEILLRYVEECKEEFYQCRLNGDIKISSGNFTKSNDIVENYLIDTKTLFEDKKKDISKVNVYEIGRNKRNRVNVLENMMYNWQPDFI